MAARVEKTSVNDSLQPWITAALQSFRPLAESLGTTCTKEELYVDTIGDLPGNYISVFGDDAAYRIGVLGTAEALTSAVRLMVGVEPNESIAAEDVYDGVGEIANILVGNMKTALGEACPNLSIGLPMMTTGAIVYPLPTHSVAVEVCLDDIPLIVSIESHPLPGEVKRRRMLENEIRAREAMLQSVLDVAPDGMFTVDRFGWVLTANAAAERLFGAEEASLCGCALAELLPGISLSEDFENDARMPSSPVESEAARADRTRFWAEVSMSVQFEPGAIRVIAVRDVSQRRELETALGEARRLDAIGQLAAGIAHEINTPIQYIGDNAQFLKDSFSEILTVLEQIGGLKGEIASGHEPAALLAGLSEAAEAADIDFLAEEIPAAAEQTMEGVARVAAIVAAMKAFSHPGKEKAPSDLNRAIQNTITISRNEWKYAAELETDLDEGLPMVSCVLGEVNQVFMNLIVNAAHAIAEKYGNSGEKGLISVSTSVSDGFVEVRIADTGGGIPEPVRDKIFEPFFTTKEVGKGTGQGLAIARNVIVKKHGGALLFETEMGKGSVFIVRLPVGGPATWTEETP